MRLLVSVTDPDEARAALAGDADIIDAKDPTRGTLAPVSVAVLAAIREAIGERRPMSVAIGDLHERATPASLSLIEVLVQHSAALRVAFVKVGIGTVTPVARAARLAAHVMQLVTDSACQVGLVIGAYADRAPPDGLSPDDLVDVAAESKAFGVLLDTVTKDRRALFHALTPDAVATWVERAHERGLSAAIAGSLQSADIALARDVGADIVGVRGAACDGGRTGRVSTARVRRLTDAMGAATVKA